VGASRRDGRCSEGGRLFPDALVVGALRARLERGDVARGFLLDVSRPSSPNQYKKKHT
jgi:hypothetical protein